MVEVRDEKIYIKIAWATGSLELTPEFFPVEMSRARKIFKMLMLDESWTKDEIKRLALVLKLEAPRRIAKAEQEDETAAEHKLKADELKGILKKSTPDEYGFTRRNYYQIERDNMKYHAQKAKEYRRQAQELSRTRDLLLEMTGVNEYE